MDLVRLVLLGAPGAGKGVQGLKLSKHHHISHISTGAILRYMYDIGDPVGIMAKKDYWGNGTLVPDEIMNKLVKKRLSRDDCKNGFILDGYPRNISQAKYMRTSISQLDKAIYLEVSDETIIKRIMSRKVCATCSRTYGLDKPQERCDCGGELKTRSDDTPEAIKKRLEEYKSKTYPLIKHYADRNILLKVNGDRDPDAVFKDINQVLRFISD